MADDRFDPPAEPPAPDDEAAHALSPEAERWFEENLDWVKAKVQEALDDPRPAIPLAEAFARVRARLHAKYGSTDDGA